MILLIKSLFGMRLMDGPKCCERESLIDFLVIFERSATFRIFLMAAMRASSVGKCIGMACGIEGERGRLVNPTRVVLAVFVA